MSYCHPILRTTVILLLHCTIILVLKYRVSDRQEALTSITCWLTSNGGCDRVTLSIDERKTGSGPALAHAMEKAIRQYGLEGVIARELDILPDARGFFCGTLRHDWTDFVSGPVLQVNLSCTYPNVVRAWHRHTKGQVDYFLV